MKKLLLKLIAWPNLLSAVIIGLFMLMAIASINNYVTEYKGNGIYEETYTDFYTDYRRTGKRDVEGRWQGKVTYEYFGWSGTYKDEGNFVNGVREGWSKFTYEDGSTADHYYKNGYLADPPKKKAEVTAFDVLGDKYSWYLFALNASGFENTYVEAFMDTIDLLLGTYDFELEEFTDYYDDVISDLEETHYDSINIVNSNLAAWEGVYLYKNDEFRLAVFDYYLNEGSGLYETVLNKYPGYLAELNSEGVANTDFEAFCSDFEDSLETFAPLDTEEPMFADSIDEQLYAVIYSFVATRKSTSSLLPYQELKPSSKHVTQLMQKIRDSNAGLKSFAVKETPADVALIILEKMMAKYDEGNLVKMSVRTSYLAKEGILTIPILSTTFISHNSATSVTLEGYIVEDGGAVITTSGIAWGYVHSPDLNDNTEESDAITGAFTVTLNSLTEGNTYFARTYATNSVGTAYGNSIEFVAEAEINSIESPELTGDFVIYPNPSNGLSVFRIMVHKAGPVDLNIYDMNGRLIYTRNLGLRPNSEIQVTLDVSALKDGVYNCQVVNGTDRRTARLVIQR